MWTNESDAQTLHELWERKQEVVQNPSRMALKIPKTTYSSVLYGHKRTVRPGDIIQVHGQDGEVLRVEKGKYIVYRQVKNTRAHCSVKWCDGGWKPNPHYHKQEAERQRQQVERERREKILLEKIGPKPYSWSSQYPEWKNKRDFWRREIFPELFRDPEEAPEQKEKKSKIKKNSTGTTSQKKPLPISDNRQYVLKKNKKKPLKISVGGGEIPGDPYVNPIIYHSQEGIGADKESPTEYRNRLYSFWKEEEMEREQERLQLLERRKQLLAERKEAERQRVLEREQRKQKIAASTTASNTGTDTDTDIDIENLWIAAYASAESIPPTVINPHSVEPRISEERTTSTKKEKSVENKRERELFTEERERFALDESGKLEDESSEEYDVSVFQTPSLYQSGDQFSLDSFVVHSSIQKSPLVGEGASFQLSSLQQQLIDSDSRVDSPRDIFYSNYNSRNVESYNTEFTSTAPRNITFDISSVTQSSLKLQYWESLSDNPETNSDSGDSAAWGDLFGSDSSSDECVGELAMLFE